MMFGLRRKQTAEVPPQAPVLDLDGPRLRRAFTNLVDSAEPTGGLERYVTALVLKASLFDELLAPGKTATMTETEFLDLAAFITPVRRRIGNYLGQQGFAPVRAAIGDLLHGAEDTTSADWRLAAFVATFPQDKAHRWARDLGAELLHFTAPTVYPLMTRWVWDARIGTGALREIWHADDVDAVEITVPDDFLTFITLRAEIDGFLATEGVFRDRHAYVDLLLAHIYAGYINDRGGQYLRTDFTMEGDPMLHTRRMLGLDAVDTETGRTRLRLIDGKAHHFGGSPTLPLNEAADAHS
jgi:hypothetical protein